MLNAILLVCLGCALMSFIGTLLIASLHKEVSLLRAQLEETRNGLRIYAETALQEPPPDTTDAWGNP